MSQVASLPTLHTAGGTTLAGTSPDAWHATAAAVGPFARSQPGSLARQLHASQPTQVAPAQQPMLQLQQPMLQLQQPMLQPHGAAQAGVSALTGYGGALAAQPGAAASQAHVPLFAAQHAQHAWQEDHMDSTEDVLPPAAFGSMPAGMPSVMHGDGEGEADAAGYRWGAEGSRRAACSACWDLSLAPKRAAHRRNWKLLSKYAMSHAAVACLRCAGRPLRRWLLARTAQRRTLARSRSSAPRCSSSRTRSTRAWRRPLRRAG
jgi:hypothetical protein